MNISLCENGEVCIAKKGDGVFLTKEEFLKLGSVIHLIERNAHYESFDNLFELGKKMFEM